MFFLSTAIADSAAQKETTGDAITSITVINLRSIFRKRKQFKSERDDDNDDNDDGIQFRHSWSYG